MNKTKAGLRRNPAVATTIVMAALLAAVAIPGSSVTANTEPAHAAAQLSRIDVNDGFAELVKAVKPAVVNISVTSYVNQSGSGKNNRHRGQNPQQLEEFFRRFSVIPSTFRATRPKAVMTMTIILTLSAGAVRSAQGSLSIRMDLWSPITM